MIYGIDSVDNNIGTAFSIDGIRRDENPANVGVLGGFGTGQKIEGEVARKGQGGGNVLLGKTSLSQTKGREDISGYIILRIKSKVEREFIKGKGLENDAKDSERKLGRTYRG